MNFFWLRHGPSNWNLTRRWQGQKNPELSKEGALLVKEWVEKVKQENISFDFIWSSSLKRAEQSAEIISEKLGTKFSTDERLQERSLGEWEGLTRTQIDNGWPGAIEKRQFPKGSESDNQVIKRVLDFLKEQFLDGGLTNIPPREKDASVLFVAHGGVITCLEEYLGAEWERLHNLSGRWIFCQPPCSIQDLQLGKRMSLLESDYSSNSASASGSL